ncbi:HIRAN domain-containing protein [Halomonas sp. MA07-2]|uniref:HIRAN domain-containing protein n=1 Tax=Halomonas sp. MA07-2 TaxID=3440841 RepID=UPI003EE8719A
MEMFLFYTKLFFLVIAIGAASVIYFYIQEKFEKKKDASDEKVFNSLASTAFVHPKSSDGGLVEDSIHASKTSHNQRLITCISGTEYKNANGEYRAKILGHLPIGSSLILRKDPENPYDKNAIEVISKNGQIGFIPKKLAFVLNSHELQYSKGKLLSNKGALNTGPDIEFYVYKRYCLEKWELDGSHNNIHIDDIAEEEVIRLCKKIKEFPAEAIYKGLPSDHRLFLAKKILAIPSAVRNEESLEIKECDAILNTLLAHYQQAVNKANKEIISIDSIEARQAQEKTRQSSLTKIQEISKERSLMYRRKRPLDIEKTNYYKSLAKELGMGNSFSSDHKQPLTYSSGKLKILESELKIAFEKSRKSTSIAVGTGQIEMERIKSLRAARRTTYYRNMDDYDNEDYEDQYETGPEEHMHGENKSLDHDYDAHDRSIDYGYLEDKN